MLGLSGGPDSVFLFHFFLEMKRSGNIKAFIAAHLDHEWRDSSALDTQFCKALAEQHGVPFETRKLSQLESALKWNGSKEEIARKARRLFLAAVKGKYNAHAIALAHHAQDQQETFFIRLLRGASLTGLTAMKPKAGAFIRPLLSTNKDSILSYLDENHIAYCVDPTNSSDAHLRNRIRSYVLPALKSADSRFEQTFAHTLQKLRETEQYLDEHASQLLAAMSSHDNGKCIVSIPTFLALPKAMQERILIKWLCHEKVPFTPSHTLMQEILRFLSSDHGGSHSVHPQWKLIKKGKSAYIDK